MPCRFPIKALVAACLLLPVTPHHAAAQAPLNYESTSHGRVLVCYAEAYSIVELVDVATKNLSQIAAEARREAGDQRPAVAAGLALAGTQIDQRQALDVAERLEQCVERAAAAATPDPAVAFVAAALRDEIGLALMLTDGFIADYSEVAGILDTFFARTTDPAAQSAPTGPFRTFGDGMKRSLTRTLTLVTDLTTRTAPR